MAIRIETPKGTDELTEFVLFQEEVNKARGASWPAMVPLLLSTVTGEGPFARDRHLRPLVAREDGRIVARALAVVDERYQRHWGERLGHVSLFEALPDTGAATRLLMDAAAEWLAQEGADAARAGMGLLEFPFAIDDYQTLPPAWLRENPAYYHSLLKDAGFETEKGFVDYKIAVRPELVERWERAREGARRGGFELVRLRDVPEAERTREFTSLWNEAFAQHWGFTPFSEAEMDMLSQFFAPAGMLDTSLLAYQGKTAVGVLWFIPETSAFASLAPGRVLTDAEKLNVLGIGVRRAARGRGVNLAMAAEAFLDVVGRGATHVSYTLVLDDNWPSRRTAEKLGATVCGNYVAYRRNFRAARR
jgi:RimJ/RimL family protein N-acetyltransferase